MPIMSRNRHLLASSLLYSLSLLLVASLSFAPQNAVAWDWIGWGKKVSGSGVYKTETRVISGYKGIKLSGSFDVVIVQNGSEGITIEAEDNLLPLISTDVESGSLVIKWAEKNLNVSHKKITMTVNVKDIEALSVAGSGNIKSDALKSTRLRSNIAGAGDINIKNLTSDTLKVSIAGSGDFAAGGSSDVFEASIAGSGGVKTDRLKTKNAKLSIAGSGDVALWATDAIKVSIAGSGDVRYYGDATVSKSVAGSGNIKRLGAAPNP